MSSVYPNAIDGYAQLPIAVDGVTEINAFSVNTLRSAIEKIEIELGVLPSGSSSTVTARLNELTAALDLIEDVMAGTIWGPTTSVNNAVLRYDGETGTIIQGSTVIIDDSGNMTIPGTVDGVDIAANNSSLISHIADTANPHAVAIGDVGPGTLAELNSTITDATLDDSSDSRTPSGSAGGDLTGTYPNPTVVSASTIQAGKVELATLAEVNTGTDSTRAITPAGLASSSLSSDVSTHIVDTTNPHLTSIANVGAGSLANLNAAITDATLDDSSDSRTPSGSAGGDLTGTYPNPTVVSASTIQAGKVELATTAEINTGTDSSRAITPAGFAASTAITSTIAHTTNTSNPHGTDIDNLGSGTLAQLNAAITDATLLDTNDIVHPDGSIAQTLATFTPVASPVYGEGKVFYDNTDKTLAVQLSSSGVTLQIGQESHVRVLNNSGSLIANGKVVYLSGAVLGRSTIALAKADSSATADSVIGLTTHDIANGSEGYVTSIGLVRDLDTTGGAELWSAGDRIYLSSSTAGELTNVEPIAPNISVRLGSVASVNALTGSIQVYSQVGYTLTQLNDVQYISTPPATGEALRWNASNSRWENASISPTGQFTVGAIGADFATITAALAATSSGDEVTVFPGTYAESFTVPTNVSLTGIGDVSITGTLSTGTRITLNNQSKINNIEVVLPTDANPAVIFSGTETAHIHDCDFIGAGANGIGVRNSGSGILEVFHCNYISGTANSLLDSTGTGTLLAIHTIFGNGTLTDMAKVSAGELKIDGLRIESGFSSTDGISVDGGAIDLLAADFNSSTLNCIHQTVNACTIIVNSSIIKGSIFDWLIDPALTGIGTSLIISDSIFRLEQLSFPAAYTVNASITATFSDTGTDNDRAYRSISEFSVGIPEIPKESAFGEGDSSVANMTVFSVDNYAAPTIWVNNTAAARSAALSVFDLFQGTGANNTAYIGHGSREFQGIKTDLDSVAMALGAGSVIFEYWSGAAWTAFEFMVSDADAPYMAHAQDSFSRANQNDQIRFDRDNMSGWATTTVNGTLSYWIRIRVVTSITTVPSLQRIKLHTNRTEINKDGFIEYFGDQEPLWVISSSRFGLGYSNTGGSAPANKTFAISANISIVMKDNAFANGDAIATPIVIPDALDTGRDLTATILWAPNANEAAANVRWDIIIATPIVNGTNIDAGTVPEVITFTTTNTTLNSADQLYQTDVVFRVPNQTPGSTIVVGIRRNAASTLLSKSNVLSVQIKGRRWHA